MSSSIYFVSLGCPKNTVDTERMVALAQRQGLSVADDPAQAEVILVNTCGFIEAAKQESINAVLEMAEQKHSGRCQTLLMAGCLSQRYSEQLAREMPEVDGFLGTADLGRLQAILARGSVDPAERNQVGEPIGLEESRFERTLTGRAHSAYLKISEGCNRPCAFCSIPLMRGRQRSRTIDSLLEEASALVATGVRELILVAQDSTAYGRDLHGQATDLVALLEALDQLEGLHWIRVHYAYPSMVQPELVEVMATSKRVAPYLDMPIQHADTEVLRRMRRGYTADHVRRTVGLLRAAMPEIWLRTTLLVGHPGETAEAHHRLRSLIEELEFDHLGAFVFSPEEGTAAFAQPDAVDAALAEERRGELLELQRQISQRRLRRLLDEEIEVLVDGPSSEHEWVLQGRHAGQSPDIDGTVILDGAQAQAGELLRARVIETTDYDVLAVPLATATTTATT